MPETLRNGKPHPIIISGFSSQILARNIAAELGSKLGKVTYRQHADNEIEPVIEENLRGHNVVVVASAAGEPNKQEKETRMLLGAANRAGAKRVMVTVAYQWYGRSDDTKGARGMPGLSDTINTIRPLAQSVLVVDPHNPVLTREQYLGGNSVQDCTIAHMAFPYAVQIKDLIDKGYISRENLVLAHADAGSTKRIDPLYRTCMYDMLGFADRKPNRDDWPQGFKGRDTKTGESKIMGFSADVSGKDVIISEDILGTGGTAVELGEVLKDNGARTVTLFATSGLLTADRKKRQPVTFAVEKINNSRLDAVFITDTYSHKEINPRVHHAIENSPVIHVIRTAPYLASIIRAMHVEIDDDTSTNENSVSALLSGRHPDQTKPDQTMARPVRLKRNCPLVLKAG